LSPSVFLSLFVSLFLSLSLSLVVSLSFSRCHFLALTHACACARAYLSSLFLSYSPLVFIASWSPPFSLCLSVCLSVYLSICLSVCLSVYLSVCLSICLSVCLSVYLSFRLSVSQSVYVSVGLSVCLFVCLSVYLSVYLSICLSICLSVCLSVCLFMYLSVCQSVYLSVYLSICLSICLSIYLVLSLTGENHEKIQYYSTSKATLRTKMHQSIKRAVKPPPQNKVSKWIKESRYLRVQTHIWMCNILQHTCVGASLRDVACMHRYSGGSSCVVFESLDAHMNMQCTATHVCWRISPRCRAYAPLLRGVKLCCS